MPSTEVCKSFAILECITERKMDLQKRNLVVHLVVYWSKLHTVRIGLKHSGTV